MNALTNFDIYIIEMLSNLNQIHHIVKPNVGRGCFSQNHGVLPNFELATDKIPYQRWTRITNGSPHLYPFSVKGSC